MTKNTNIYIHKIELKSAYKLHIDTPHIPHPLPTIQWFEMKEAAIK
jgi:hypothetical protein